MVVDDLSDGFRSILSMVADLAYRMVRLNPQLGAQAVVATPGVVLIDEIDMHLHPLWQQTVLLDMQRAFPKVQFIVTTHSPQVLSSVPAESVSDKTDQCVGIVFAVVPAHHKRCQIFDFLFRIRVCVRRVFIVMKHIFHRHIPSLFQINTF